MGAAQRLSATATTRSSTLAESSDQDRPQPSSEVESSTAEASRHTRVEPAVISISKGIGMKPVAKSYVTPFGIFTCDLFT